MEPEHTEDGWFTVPQSPPNPSTWADIDPATGQMAIGCTKAEWDLAKQVPGATIGKDDIWRTGLSWAGYASMRHIFFHQGITIWPALEAWGKQALADAQQRYQLRGAIDCVYEDMRRELQEMDRPGTTLEPFQRGDVAWQMTYRRSILGSERGNGKTPPTIRSMQLLHAKGELGPALVICPDSSPLAWQRKLAAWAPEIRTVLITDKAADRRKAIAALKAGEADVGIIIWQNIARHTRIAHYPGLAFTKCDEHGGMTGKTRVQCQVHPKEFNLIDPDGDEKAKDNQWRFRTVVIDEAHHAANPKSQQTRAVWWLAHQADTVWATTGTLTTTDVGTLWPVLHAIDPVAFPVKSKYLDLFAVKDFAFMGKGEVILDLRPDTADLFHWIVDGYFRRIPRQFARTGAPRLLEPEFLYADMTPKQAKLYATVVKAGLAELDGQRLVPDNAAVKVGRLCQLASSMIELYDGEDPLGFTAPAQVKLVPPSNKISALIDVLWDRPGQWVVAANSPSLIAMAEEKLRERQITSTHIIGGMSYAQKDAAAQAFQRGEHRVCFITDAGGEAIDLFAARGIIWIQPDPSFVSREQKTGRVDRHGQTDDVEQIVILAPGTVDIRMWELGLDKAEKHASVVHDPDMLQWLYSVEPGTINQDIGEMAA
jgi:SNF2 family DNA or RNA helicase